MAFLRNKTVNLLNLHYGMAALAMSGGGVFIVVFLLKAGLPAPAVLGTFALILTGRFCVRPLVLLAGKRVGLRPLVIFGTLAIAAQYPILAAVHGLDWALLALIGVAAIGDTFYWTAYHAYFAALGDAEHRGHQTGAREALASVVGIVAPLAGGWALTTLGPQVAFGAVAVVQVVAALPLLGTPEVGVARQVEGGFAGVFKASAGGFALYMADGWVNAGSFVVWEIALFVHLSQSFTAFGGAMALAAFAGAVGGLLLGRHIDAGGGGRAVWLSFAVLAVTIAARVAANGPVMAVAANALGALVVCLYAPTMMTAAYNLAQRSPCPLRFQVMAEGGWDLGCGAGCLAAAGLLALGTPLQAVILISLIGAAVSLMLLRRYYAGVGAAASAAAA